MVEGVRRYGFHGLSYEWAVSTLGSQLGERAVIAHLGSGSSLAAVLHGRAHDTTMGLTPIGGLMMSSRSGDVDPGALVHLMRSRGLDADGLERLVEDESGLLGVSGFAVTCASCSRLARPIPRAALAVDLWVMTVRKHIGAMTAALGGIDTLVFTGGIGERSQVLRDEICAGPRLSRRLHRARGRGGREPHRRPPHGEGGQLFRLSTRAAATRKTVVNTTRIPTELLPPSPRSCCTAS